VKDKNLSTNLTEADLVDVTLDLLQDPNTSGTDKEQIRALLRQKSGWHIKLDVNTGEKVLAPPVVFTRRLTSPRSLRPSARRVILLRGGGDGKGLRAPLRHGKRSL